MSRQRKPIDWDEALRLHQEGWTYQRIADRFGYRHATVARGLKARGAHPRRKHQRMVRPQGRRLYGLWRFLRGRCEDPSHRDYAAYGGRGIRFARAWRDFDAFYDWAIASGYRAGLRLKRHRTSRGYTPGNCRWVTATELFRGRPGRPVVLVEAFGECKSRAEWARDRRCKVSRESLQERLAAGWPADDAIATPPRGKPSRRVRPAVPQAKRGSGARIDWPRAIALYRDQGLSTKEVARRLGATRDGISKGLRRHGIRLRSRSKAPWDRERRRLFETWMSIHRRCEDRGDPLYPFHGARGITVARAWRTFEPFEAWARAHGARPGLWLARKDRRKGWSPANCEWVPPAEAVRRQGPRARPPPRRLLTAFGETKGLTAWGKDPRCSVRDLTIARRLDKGWATEDAIAQPPANRGSSDCRLAVLRAFGEERSKREWLRDRRCGGIGPTGLNYRLEQGWPAEDAIATPPWGRQEPIGRTPRSVARRPRRGT